MSEIPLEEAPGQVTDAAHDAARGQVVYLTEHGERLAAIVPAELAAAPGGRAPPATPRAAGRLRGRAGGARVAGRDRGGRGAGTGRAGLGGTRPRDVTSRRAALEFARKPCGRCLDGRGG